MNMALVLNAKMAQPGMNVWVQNGIHAVQNVGNQVVQEQFRIRVLQNVGYNRMVLQLAEIGHLARNCTVRPRRRDDCLSSDSVVDMLKRKKAESNSKLKTNLFETFKSLAKEADESLAKHKALELEIERLLRAVVSQDIMSIVQNPSVVDSSNLQTELDRMFRINPFKPFREEKFVPNKVRASVRTTPITVSQPHVVTEKDVNSDSNGVSSTGVDNTAKTKAKPMRNTKE
ncbi:hypothetical protein Tco_0922155 [Tanacetum coccineum]|uniref:Uncharacterized protein n=1 Tax=Tanacetum coccineum TaxID=301880 RepID=A0ABQ5CXD0_9ASTR